MNLKKKSLLISLFISVASLQEFGNVVRVPTTNSPILLVLPFPFIRARGSAVG
jgi:hypothetical protein